MKKIRVLIVDDSVVARGVITAALDTHETEVVGSAATGAIALLKLPRLNPDCVLLDAEMPQMDGIETLRRIREKHPKLPVVMFCTLTERCARLTMEALAYGANDYLIKPAPREGEPVQETIRRLLVPKLVALCRPDEKQTASARWSESPFQVAAKTGQHAQLRELLDSIVAAPSNDPVPPRAVPRAPAVPREGVPEQRAPAVPHILAIASSTGGPNALIEIIPALPADFPIPIVIVQHMPPIFTKLLAERLGGLSKLPVNEVEGGEVLQPGMVYVAPGNHHVEVVSKGTKVVTALNDGPPENSVRPAADVLFRSVARVYGQHAMCAVLTGMGCDGMAGAREIVQVGGRVLAQSGPTCVVWGMPKAVEQAGLCEAVVPIGEMAMAIMQRVRTPARQRSGG